jgi:2-amino-4-hydroxy-6-hydroxymethyldihydropteridine diphosphokinase
MPRAWISVGSNQQRQTSLRAGLAQLRQRYGALIVSPVYVEDACGRIRGPDRFAPRTLDLDLLTWGDRVQAVGPELPRREILEYAFVLRPLADVAERERHPVVGCTYGELWRGFDAAAQPLSPVALDLDPDQG